MYPVPSVSDETATYNSWVWSQLTGADPVYNTAASNEKIGAGVTTYDIHGNTECDDVWANLRAYTRRTTGRGGYLERATAFRNYLVNHFATGEAGYNADKGFGCDHFYGWGLQEYATLFSDAPAAALALSMCNEVRDTWLNVVGGGSWPVAGTYTMAYYGHRGGARNLLLATVVADATSNANAIELRDHLIDLWMGSPDWDDVNTPAGGMYWPAQFTFAAYGMEDTVPPHAYGLSHAAGDRGISPFHIGQLANAFWEAYNSANVTTLRKAKLRAKIIAMADFVLRCGLDPTANYVGSVMGIYGSTGLPWHKEGPNFSTADTGVWDGSYTFSWVNLLVMAYKLVGDRKYLDDTATSTKFPAKHCFNRASKMIKGGLSRECTDTQVAHYIDTTFDNPNYELFAYNKGALQYSSLIFENGGLPTLQTSALAIKAASMSAGQWATFACNYPTTFTDLIFSGGIKNITEYSDKMVWDEDSKKIYFTGGGHSETPYTIVYDDMTNTWAKSAAPPWFSGGTVYHAYEHNAYANGTHYFNLFNSTTIETRNIRLDPLTNTWGTLTYTAATTSYGGNATVTGAFEFFPTYGLGGSLMMWKQDVFGIWRYRFSTAAWTQVATESRFPGVAGYGFMHYSPVRDLLYFGAGTKLYSMSNAGVITDLDLSCPFDLSLNNSITWADPVSGDFCAQGDDQVMRIYTPGTGWSTATAPSSSFFTTGYPTEGPVMAIVACPIPEYGVTVFVPVNGGGVWLRKGGA